ncbi:MAG: hypothetical protein EXS14_00775 [Planctomycetes bacterium]|nr:hypothetical protein [Planctomycetota bacterium]
MPTLSPPQHVLDNSCAFFVLRGKDPVRFLNGLCTQDLGGMKDGAGARAFVLEPKGRSIALIQVVRVGEEIHGWTERNCHEVLIAHLRKYATIADISVSVSVVPALRSLINTSAMPLSLPEAGVINPIGVATSGSLLQYKDDSWGIATWVRPLTNAAEADGAPDVQMLNPWRVDAGMPRYGIDIDSGVLPAESGLEARTVSYTKGCYCGQEVVAKQHWLGKPRNRLVFVRSKTELCIGTMQLPNDGTLILSSAAPKPDGTGWSALAMMSAAQIATTENNNAAEDAPLRIGAIQL